MRHLTFVMPYYLNPAMLKVHYDLWQSYHDDCLSFVDFVIVDDGSPRDHAASIPIPDRLKNKVKIYRISEDIPWNQHGARNLGAHVADGPWLFLTDMDHAMPEKTLRELLKMEDESCAYTFYRVDAPDMTPTVRPDGSKKPHPNTFAMTKALYWKVGGYDEEFCGMYGTDGLFRQRLWRKANQCHLKKSPIIRYSREVVPDASTTTLTRKDGQYRIATKDVLEKKRREGRSQDILLLNFRWSQVA